MIEEADDAMLALPAAPPWLCNMTLDELHRLILDSRRPDIVPELDPAIRFTQYATPEQFAELMATLPPRIGRRPRSADGEG